MKTEVIKKYNVYIVIKNNNILITAPLKLIGEIMKHPVYRPEWNLYILIDKYNKILIDRAKKKKIYLKYLKENFSEIKREIIYVNSNSCLPFIDGLRKTSVRSIRKRFNKKTVIRLLKKINSKFLKKILMRLAWDINGDINK